MDSPFRTVNKTGLRSQPAVKTQNTANKYMARQIALGNEKSQERAQSKHAGTSNVAQSELEHDKQAKDSLKASTFSHKYANQYKTNPAKPQNPQNAGSKNQFEEVKPKKYKKADLKDKQIMGLNATFDKNKTPGTDTQTMTNNPYESVRYNIPSERGDSADKPIGHDKELEAADTKKQLNRRKAMKLVKAVVDETYGGTGGPGLGMGEKSVGDLTSAEPTKNYVIKKKKPAIKLSAFKEKLRESGFVGAGGNDASPTQDDPSVGTVSQMITVDSPSDKKKTKKNVAVHELSVPQGTTGKRKNTFTPMVPIRMANGEIKRLPPGKSGSSGGGGK